MTGWTSAIGLVALLAQDPLTQAVASVRQEVDRRFHVADEASRRAYADRIARSLESLWRSKQDPRLLGEAERVVRAALDRADGTLWVVDYYREYVDRNSAARNLVMDARFYTPVYDATMEEITVLLSNAATAPPPGAEQLAVARAGFKSVLDALRARLKDGLDGQFTGRNIDDFCDLIVEQVERNLTYPFFGWDRPYTEEDFRELTESILAQLDAIPRGSADLLLDDETMNRLYEQHYADPAFEDELQRMQGIIDDVHTAVLRASVMRDSAYTRAKQAIEEAVQAARAEYKRLQETHGPAYHEHRMEEIRAEHRSAREALEAEWKDKQAQREKALETRPPTTTSDAHQAPTPEPEPPASDLRVVGLAVLAALAVGGAVVHRAVKAGR